MFCRQVKNKDLFWRVLKIKAFGNILGYGENKVTSITFSQSVLLYPFQKKAAILSTAFVICKYFEIGRVPKRQILDSSKLKEFADDNFDFDENGAKFSKEGQKKCTADT